MIISPPAPITNTVARLTAGQRGVIASLPERNDHFRKTIKGLGFHWDFDRRSWWREIDILSGPIPDRTIETAAVLHRAGFVIDLDGPLASRLQSGDWQPERRRWVIIAGDRIGLYWRGQDENLWRWSHTLPGAAYDKDSKSVTISPIYFAEIIGFAEKHGFEIQLEARAKLAEAERNYSRNILPSIPEPVQVKVKRKNAVRACDPARFADLPDRKLVTLTQLLAHQQPAVEKLLPIRLGALFMDMGTGKTRCAIELVARRQARLSKVVWFCPVTLKATIAAEIAKHTSGESVHVFDDSTTDSNIPPAFWYIVGIESMSASDRVVLAVNALIDSDTFVIVDESSYIKGHAAKRSMRITEIGKRARYRLLLTGTPISQGIEDLYAQMRFLSPDILGYSSFYTFARDHLEYSEKYPGLIVRAHGVNDIAARIAPYTYQVTKAECLNLPEKLYDQVFFHLTDEQRSAYEQAKHDILLGRDPEDVNSYTIFQLFTALQQIVSGFRNIDGQTIEFKHCRLEALQTALDSIPQDDKVVIWTKYIYSLRQISTMLPGSALYYGDLSESERQAQINRFRGDSSFRHLIATQATGGHGLTLNEARYHVFYENEFKYSHRVQAEDRSHRIGQTQPVTYIDIYSNSGIDDRIRKALAKKEDVVKYFRAEVQKNRRVEL